MGEQEESEQKNQDFKIPKRKKPIEPPKQTLQGLSQTWQPGLSEFCIGLRGPGVEQQGVRGRMAENSYRAGAKMVERLEKLAWNKAKTAKHRDRALEMIARFRSMVSNPQHEDIMQLRQYLLPFLKEEPVDSVGDKQGKKLKLTGTRSLTPMSLPDTQTAKPGRTWVRDVRKDEWWSLGQLKAVQAQDREKEEQDKKVLQGIDTRFHLANAKANLLKNRDKEMEEERTLARHMKAQHQVWLEKERNRKLALQNKHLEDQAEMARLQQANEQRVMAGITAGLAEDKANADKLKRLIQQDKEKAERKKLQHRSDMMKVLEYNAIEQEHKKAEILRIRAEDIQAMKDYEMILEKREQERKAALAALFRNQEEQAGKAAEIEAEAAEADRVLEAKNKAHQEALARKQDQQEEERMRRQRQGQDECLAALNQQQVRLAQDDHRKLELNREQAAEAKRAYIQGVKDDNAKAQRRKDQNFQHRRDIERQIKQFHGILKDGVGERGMTEFEKKYNARELQLVGEMRKRNRGTFTITSSM